MEVLTDFFKNTNTFEEMTRIMMDSHVQSVAREVLSEIGLQNNVKARELLSVYLINSYPAEVFSADKVTRYQNVSHAAYRVIFDTFTNLKSNVLAYISAFKAWKQSDYQDLINDMFQRYHQLGVDILNAPESAHETLKECREGILREARNVGGPDLVQQILSYKPVVINLEELQNQYDRAFWDSFREKYDAGDYNLLFLLLDEIKKILLAVDPSNSQKINDVLDVPFIRQQILAGAYSPEELRLLTNAILDLIKRCQAPAHDNDLEILRNTVNGGNIYFPDIFPHMIHLLRTMILEIEELRNRND